MNFLTGTLYILDAGHGPITNQQGVGKYCQQMSWVFKLFTVTNVQHQNTQYHLRPKETMNCKTHMYNLK